MGVPPIERPIVATFHAKVLERSDEPANQRARLIIATRDPSDGRPIKVRINVDLSPGAPAVSSAIQPGALITLKARLMPPAPPMLPGAYNFARAAWFAGLSASGSSLGPIRVDAQAPFEDQLSSRRAALSSHITERLSGSAGGIAAALATGDHGAIAADDAQAMRDAGLAHLLSISGLHVSAVIAAAYVLALRTLALSPWIALRMPLPVVAAGCGAASGLAYTLFTGSEVPTVRSCVGALLVLGGLVLGREALSLRTLGLAAVFIMVLWPEAVIGPSFQMSFAAVLVLVSLTAADPVRKWLAPRDEGIAMRILRHLGLVLVTGIVIELALMPIGFYHFHRAGAYGAMANVVAIPLTTFVVMPLTALALVLDVVGIGWPIWMLAGQSIQFLLKIAHVVAASPGAVTTLPAFGAGPFLLFVAGGLWLALVETRVRLIGLVPMAVGTALLWHLTPPDILITGDGQHIAILNDKGDRLAAIRNSKSDYVSDNLSEIAGVEVSPLKSAEWPGTRCNRDFCHFVIHRSGQTFRLLVTRSRNAVPERSLAAGCDRADIVIANRWLPRSCRPAWLKADRRMLAQTGGATIHLADRKIRTVADLEGEHGWWRGLARPF